jgi:hypothetical protein
MLEKSIISIFVSTLLNSDIGISLYSEFDFEIYFFYPWHFVSEIILLKTTAIRKLSITIINCIPCSDSRWRLT